MPQKKQHGKGKQGGDGLTDRERLFVQHARENPAATLWEHAEFAGYLGDKRILAKRATEVMHKPMVLAAIMAPLRDAQETISDADLREEIRRKFRSILNNSRSTPDLVVKAGKELLATIVGGYVPVQVDSKNVFNLEVLVKQMGGAPVINHPALKAPDEEA